MLPGGGQIKDTSSLFYHRHAGESFLYEHSSRHRRVRVPAVQIRRHYDAIVVHSFRLNLREACMVAGVELREMRKRQTRRKNVKMPQSGSIDSFHYYSYFTCTTFTLLLLTPRASDCLRCTRSVCCMYACDLHVPHSSILCTASEKHFRDRK